MSVKANYMKLGVFVILTFCLLVVGVIFWGADAFDQEKYYAETYIGESVLGLTVGSPVYSQGVKIGEVEQIMFIPAIYDMPVGSATWDQYSEYVYVLMALNYDQFMQRTDREAVIENLVARGLRLRISSNPLTGIAYLQTDMLDPNEHPPMSVPWTPEHAHIPSAPSLMGTLAQGLENTVKRLEKLDIEGVVGNAKKMLANLDKAIIDARTDVLSAKVETLATRADAVLIDAKSMLRSTESPKAPVVVETLMANANSTIESLNQAIADVDVKSIGEQGKNLLAELRESNQKLQAILRSTEESKPPAAIDEVVANLNDTIRHINLLIKQYEPIMSATLGNLADTSENVRESTEDIKRQPSKILFSKPPAKSEVTQ
jgi:phospholipid/cholesterol/gamma-HCH transport system substrate-binding protein/paraquat-inducible protein B